MVSLACLLQLSQSCRAVSCLRLRSTQGRLGQAWWVREQLTGHSPHPQILSPSCPWPSDSVLGLFPMAVLVDHCLGDRQELCLRWLCGDHPSSDRSCLSMLYSLCPWSYQGGGGAAVMKMGWTEPHVRRPDDCNGLRLSVGLCLEPLSLRETA